MSKSLCNELYLLAKDLRMSQKKYFTSRSPYLLREAKAKESKMDKLLIQIEAKIAAKTQNTQSKLDL